MHLSGLWFWLLVGGVLIGAYLLGGVPWSLIIGRRFYGVDLRDQGSGNLGATNVFRTLGARAAIFTVVLDMGKGVAAVGLARLLISRADYGMTVSEWVAVGAVAAAVLGHSYSPYIKMRGGKGVATSAGGLLVLTPVALLLEVALFASVIAASKMVSLGSVIAAAVYPVLVAVLYPGNTPLLITVVVLASLVIWRHRGNIGRIVRGEESKISIRQRGSALAERVNDADEGATSQDEGDPQ